MHKNPSGPTKAVCYREGLLVCVLEVCYNRSQYVSVCVCVCVCVHVLQNKSN